MRGILAGCTVQVVGCGQPCWVDGDDHVLGDHVTFQFVQIVPGEGDFGQAGEDCCVGKLELVTGVHIGGDCEVVALAGDDLYAGAQTEVVKVDLVNGESDKVAAIFRGEKLTGPDVKTQTVIVLHLGTKSIFLRSGEFVDQMFCGGASLKMGS